MTAIGIVSFSFTCVFVLALHTHMASDEGMGVFSLRLICQLLGSPGGALSGERRSLWD